MGSYRNTSRGEWDPKHHAPRRSSSTVLFSQNMPFPFLLLFSASWDLRTFVVNRQRCISSTPESQTVLLCAFNKPSTEAPPAAAAGSKALLEALSCRTNFSNAFKMLFLSILCKSGEEPACLAWLRGSAGFASPHPTVQMPQFQRGLQA